MAADLVEYGIHMAGGGALLHGIDSVLSATTGLQCTIADDPLTCVARRTAIYLENLSAWKDAVETDDDDQG